MPENSDGIAKVGIGRVPQLGTIRPDAVIFEEVTSETPFVKHLVGVTDQKGLEVRTIDEEELQFIPRRPQGERTVTDLESFLSELARRPLTESGTLWGNAERGVVNATYNDHTSNQPGWRDDILTLQLVKDEDWVKWHNISGKYYSQSEFGDLVEDLLHTVTSPDQADLLETIDTIRASTKGEFENTISRADGAQTVTYNTEVTSTAGRTRQLEVPQTITLSLRPWEGHDTLYDVVAYFRLRIVGNALSLAVKLKPTRQIVRNAWADVTTTITSEVDKPVLSQK
jgi:uncharacterized protein YfdQ (DUF2303 family)